MNRVNFDRVLNLTKVILTCAAGLIAVEELAMVSSVGDLSSTLAISLLVSLLTSWPHSARVAILLFAGAGVAGLAALAIEELAASADQIENARAFLFVKGLYLLPLIAWICARIVRNRNEPNEVDHAGNGDAGQ